LRTAGLVMLWVCTAGDVFGQAPAKIESTFEVASVKPSAPDVRGMFIRPLPGGGLQVTGASLKNLISLAYNVRPFQIIGESQWVDTERFDIDARTETSNAGAATNPADDRRKINEGLKSLLADRFQLALHSETKEQAVYVLVVNKGGPKLKESTEPRSLIRMMGRGTIKGQAVALGMLVLNLSNELGRRVIDRTGLSGKYDFELKWDSGQDSAAQIRSTQTTELALPADIDVPSIFTALQEQLGLRLESGKGPVEVLVVDRAERPSKN
jgi:bla regulator protein blaR1